MLFDNLRQDVRYALRGLRTKPGFTIAVIATLGLGIGANSAMFGIVDRLLFRPPDLMKDPNTAHRLYLYQTFRGAERANGGAQFARYLDFAKETKNFSDVAQHTSRDLAVGVGDAARERPIGIVSANFFNFFDAPPAFGRYFTSAEDQPPAGEAVAVLSYRTWQLEYNGRDVRGEKIQIGPVIYSIIGVSAPRFVGLWPDKPPIAYIPISSYAATQFNRTGVDWWTTYSWTWSSTILRRKPGVSLEAANADLTQAFVKSYRAQLVEQPRGQPIEISKPHAEAGSILSARGPNAGPSTKVATWVGGVSLIVLLIACANVANLLLARALRRRREIALRLALGVTRARLFAQLLTESVVLAVMGGAAGILVATWGGAVLRHSLLSKSEAAAGFRDPRTVLFTFGVAIVVGLVTGLAPVFQSRRADLTSDLKSGAREGTFHKSRTGVALLVLQGALSVILLVGAGLFVRSLNNVQAVPLGYDVKPILLVNLNMRGVKLDSLPSIELRQRLLATAKTIPGVENAALQRAVPFWSSWSTNLVVEGIDTVSKLGQFNLNAVSPEFFATMGTRIMKGRGVSDEDRDGTRRVMIVSQGMGKVLFPGKDPIDQCVKVSQSKDCTYVVGIAQDIKDQNLTGDSAYYYYLPAAQAAPQQSGLFVRVRGDAAKMLQPIRARLQKEMPGASYVTLVPFEEIVGGQMQSWQLGATMFVVFGILALVLAAVGLYSVIAYNVAQRTHELAVRVALGAEAKRIVRLVVGEGLRVALIGVVGGTAIALYVVKWLTPLLFKVGPRDPAVFVTVAGVLIAVAIAACAIPALRASKADPNTALRAE